MHALTVPVTIEDDEYVKKNIKKEWYKEDGSVYIPIKLDEDLLDDYSFTIRHYIPHFTLNDKLMYLYATIMQHYNNLIFSGPYTPYKYEWEKDDSGLNERMAEWEEKMKDFKAKSVHDSNASHLEDFKEEVKCLEEALAYSIRRALFGEAPKSCYWDEDGVYHIIPEEEREKDTRPEVTVKFEYFVDKDEFIHTCEGPDDWFSTGCYGNEEFYYALSYGLSQVSWLLNPYAAVLAGSDEQDDEDSLAQVTEAKRLIEESWKKYVEKSSKEDEEDGHHLILNPGKVLWPCGG